MRKFVISTVLASVLAVFLTACGAQQSAQDASLQAADKLNSQIYQAKHNVEFRNYNLRQKLADDPSTILWCTFFPQTVGQEPFTIPIAGKLTSSGKRPYDSVSDSIPGPDHMFGSSVEYRYGFDPTLTQYTDFTALPSMCTTVPYIWQQNSTRVVIGTSATLSSISSAAQSAIQAGNAGKALTILKKAESPK